MQLATVFGKIILNLIDAFDGDHLLYFAYCNLFFIFTFISLPLYSPSCFKHEPNVLKDLLICFLVLKVEWK